MLLRQKILGLTPISDDSACMYEPTVHYIKKKKRIRSVRLIIFLLTLKEDFFFFLLDLFSHHMYLGAYKNVLSARVAIISTAREAAFQFILLTLS